MSHDCVFTSRRTKLAATGILLFIVTILFCAAMLTPLPVNAKMGDNPRTELAQPIYDGSPDGSLTPTDLDHLDATFPVSHVGILNYDDVYEYFVNLFDAKIESGSDQAAAAANVQIDSPDGQYISADITGTLTAGQVQSVTIPVEAVTTAAFVVMSKGPISVTLVTPAGQTIDPDTLGVDPNVSYDEAQVNISPWYYRYLVEDPTDGLWRIQLKASATTTFVAFAAGASPLLVHIDPDGASFEPGQTVTLETGVREEAGAFQAGFVFTGTVQLPDYSTFLPLTFHDDGVQGDKAAGDNIYTTQFTPPDVSGDLEIFVQATKGNIVRLDSLLVAVVAQTATILGVGNERAMDANGNGFFDALTVDVVIDVLEAGNYSVYGDLYAGSGEKIADGVYTTLRPNEPFATGVQTVTLTFDGKTLRESGIDGPYVLDYLDMKHYAAEFYFAMTVDFARTVYTTTAYTADQFEGEALRALTASDSAEDQTGDGLFDSLTVSVTFDVLQPGLYQWSGGLVDSAGVQVARAGHRAWLDSQTPALFIFAGKQLREAGRDGPYTLTDIYIDRLAETVELFYFGKVHRTAAYQAAQFGTTPIVMTGAHAAIDLNGNGLYDQLVISATMVATMAEGEYEWSGQVIGPAGAAVGAPITGTSRLYDGRSIPFVVYSPPPRQANLDGAYSLQNVVITHRELPTVTVAIPLLYTTPPFQAAQFDPWELQAAGIGAQAIDANANGLYDKLLFTTTLNIPLPGAYYLHYALVSQQAPETVIWGASWSWWYPQGPITKAVAFTGPVIAEAGLDGPYILKLVNATYYPPDAEEEISFILAEAQNLFTTAAYAASQFEGFPATPTPTSETGRQGDCTIHN